MGANIFISHDYENMAKSSNEKNKSINNSKYKLIIPKKHLTSKDVIPKRQNQTIYKKNEGKKSKIETDITQIHNRINRFNDNRSNINNIYKNIFESRSSISQRKSINVSNLSSGNFHNNLSCSNLPIAKLKFKRISSIEESKNIFCIKSPFDNNNEINSSNINNITNINININEENRTSNINEESTTSNIFNRNSINGNDEISFESIIPAGLYKISNNINTITNFNTHVPIDKNKENEYKGFEENNDINIKQVFESFEKNLINSEKIRNQYYSKLILTNIWEMEKRNHNSIFIFDWDDTILATHHITPNGYFSNNYNLKEKDIALFKELDRTAFILLNLAIVKGKTFIVTNAVSGWVEMSARLFLPEVSKILKHLTIISARGSFENQFPGNSRKWKIETFLEIQKCFKSNLVTNLICIGDSIIEMEAAHIISKKFQNMHLKTVKFIEKPKPEEVIKELKLVIKNFNMIFSSIKGLTIQVGKKFLEKPQPIIKTKETSKKQK